MAFYNIYFFLISLCFLCLDTVKQLDSVSLEESTKSAEENKKIILNFAGCGAVSIKREVHGYKKLSIIDRRELSRTELSLPPLEFESFGIYFCAEPVKMRPLLGDSYGDGVHALSHALLAVSPLFAKGISPGDLECGTYIKFSKY